MFCKICGRMIAENALFCTFCGTPVAESSSEPVQTSSSAQPTQAEQLTADPVTEETAPVSELTAPVTEQAAPTAQPSQPAAVPMQQNSAVTQSTAFEYSLQPPAPQPKEQKYYTLGHIVMCLAAVGVMAIVAGVFAGLYFSVI